MTIGKLTKIAAAIVIMTGLYAGQALADKAELEQKLNENIKVDLNDVTIADALKQIGEQAGVEFVLSEGAKWKLPKGEATKLSLSLEGPLSDALTEMLNAFFMRYAVGIDKITIYPRPELEHIVGRPTTKQLELLKRIYTMVITFSSSDGSKIFGKMLSTGFGKGANIVILPVSEYMNICDSIDFMTRGLKGGDNQSPPMTLSQLLEINEGKTWYIAGPDFAKNVIEIRIVDEGEFLHSVILEQKVDLSFENVEAQVVVQQLKMLAEGKLEVHKNDPSWLIDKISIDMQNVKLSEALKNITSALDGKWTIGDKFIIEGPLGRKVQMSAKTTVSANKTTVSGEGYVGKISIPMDGGKYFIEFMLRESDLTEELRNLRKAKIKEILEKASAEAAQSAERREALIKAAEEKAKAQMEANIKEQLKKAAAEAEKSKN